MGYDIKKLVLKLKENGLDVAEEAAKDIVVSTLDWVVEEAAASPNKIDDIIAGLIPMIKPVILEQIDKIDGHVG